MIIRGKQSIFQLLDEAKKLVSAGTIELANEMVRNDIWNRAGRLLYINNLLPDCERLNSDLLEILETHDCSKKVPRGQVLYNLGITQINQGDYDKGIPNILNAWTEDEECFGKQKASQRRAALTGKYIRTFTTTVVDREFTPELRKNVKLDKGRATTTEKILEILPAGDELLLFKVVNSIPGFKFRLDNYSRVLMFDHLKILCLLLENSLRIVGRGNTLYPLVCDVFRTEPWLQCLKSNWRLTSYGDPTKTVALRNFESHLTEIESRKFVQFPSIGTDQDRFLIYAFLKAALLRNLTAHLFDLNASILSNKLDYESAFKIVMLSLLYSLHFQS